MKLWACLFASVLLAGCGSGGGGGSSSGGGSPPGGGPAPSTTKTVTASASATQPTPGPVTQVLLAVTHNVHEDPSTQNGPAAFAALDELQQDSLVVASHKFIPNTAPGVWDFSGLDNEMNFLTQPGLPGTLVYNLSHCPAYMARGAYSGTAPVDDSQFALYCQRLVQYYNTASGFSDGAAVFKRSPLNIKYWELWGEPDLNEFFDDNQLPELFSNMSSQQQSLFLSTPQAFRTMYETAVPLMKAADPTIKVGGPGVTDIEDPQAQAYVTQLLTTNQPLDFVSYHDYATWRQTTADQDAFAEVPQLVQIAQQIQGQILASSHPQAELWVTEGNGNPEADTTPPFDQRARNHFDVAYLASLVRGYTLAGVRGFGRYDFMQPVAFNGAIYGALDDSGNRYPAFYGWKLLTTNLVRGAALRQASLVDPQPVNGQPTVEILALQPGAKTLNVLVINKTATSPTANSSQNPPVQGAAVTVDLAITDGTVAAANLQRVDPLSTGLETVSLPPGPTLTFDVRGYGVACVQVTLN